MFSVIPPSKQKLWILLRLMTFGKQKVLLLSKNLKFFMDSALKIFGSKNFTNITLLRLQVWTKFQVHSLKKILI